MEKQPSVRVWDRKWEPIEAEESSVSMTTISAIDVECRFLGTSGGRMEKQEDIPPTAHPMPGDSRNFEYHQTSLPPNCPSHLAGISQ